MASKTTKYLSLRGVRVSSTLGHTAVFVAGEPREIPPALVDAAAAAGCVPVDGELNKALKKAEAAEAKAAKEAEASDDTDEDGPSSPTDDDRKARVASAIDAVLTRGKRSQLNTSGIPRVSAIRAEVGLNDISAAEVEAAFHDRGAAA